MTPAFIVLMFYRDKNETKQNCCLTAGEMDPWLKVLAVQARWPEFNPQSSQKKHNVSSYSETGKQRRENHLEACSLISLEDTAWQEQKRPCLI